MLRKLKYLLAFLRNLAVQLLKKLLFTVLGRVVIVLLISIFFTSLLFGYVENKAELKFSVPEDNSKSFTQTSTTKIEDIKNLIPLLKLPISLLKFYIYAKNDIHVLNGEEELITHLDTNIPPYSTNVKTGETKQIFNQSMGIDDLGTVSIEHSIKPQNFDVSKYDSLKIANNSVYIFFIKPTYSSMFIAWLAVLVYLYGGLILISSWLKFLLTGSPVVEVIEEYIKKAPK